VYNVFSKPQNPTNILIVLNILFLEPFYGGSHKYFADGLAKHSRHRIDLLTLPGRFWKWRMRGAALELTERRPEKRYDLVLAGNLLDLAQWKALNPDLKVPHLLYVHENQLAYPLSPGEERDFQYGWTDYINMLCADRVIFNSAFNRDSFLTCLTELAGRLPDCRPRDPSGRLSDRMRIIPPGCRLAAEPDFQAKCEETGEAPLIVWNHRWEHDKNPEEFFRILEDLRDTDFSFRLALLGESYSRSPGCFQSAPDRFRKELVHSGYLESRQEYEAWLNRADFVISTAVQENFGISVVEAVSAGALPLLPDRLAYPEVLPEWSHRDLIYRDSRDLPGRIRDLSCRPDLNILRKKLTAAVQPYGWKEISRRFDTLFEEAAGSNG